MKPLFYSVLYVSVGMGALAFSTWLFVHFELHAQEGGQPFPAEESTVPKKEEVSVESGVRRGEEVSGPALPDLPEGASQPAGPVGGSDLPSGEGDLSLPEAFPTLPEVHFPEQGERQPASLHSPTGDILSDLPEAEGETSAPKQEREPMPEEENQMVTEEDGENNFSDDTPEGIRSNFRSRVAYIQQILSEYRYDPTQKRNPFVPPLSEQPPPPTTPSHRTQVEQVLPPVESPVEEEAPYIPTPSEMYELKDMHLVGITWGTGFGSSKAFFKDPSNTIHELQKNDRIGKNKGIIYQIREDEVVILEERIGQEQAYVPVIVTLNRLNQIR